MQGKKSYMIRQAISADYLPIADMIEAAFKHEVCSDQQEQHLVARLRSTHAFVSELSLVAEVEHQIVGHILLTQIEIENTKQKGLSLAPLSVLPAYRRQGIGAALIERAQKD